MATNQSLNNYKNICILATKHSISPAEYSQLTDYFGLAQFTLIAPKFDGDGQGRLDLWVDGARSGFLKVLTISRRMSWSGFDLVINWEQGGLEKALCIMLLPKPQIITKQQFLAENT
ncbi:MAG: hypothetical protein COB24_08650 [Hyphomicrobiales bacterium]|nr:MAG: hypothetical protein COB24_08650 [Hyphomicrobiales bacterium]